jgi:hypothetical protein
MTKTEILEKLSDIHVAKFQLKKYLMNHFPDLYASIKEHTLFLSDSDNVSIIERVFCIQNDLTERPVCRVCGKPVKFDATRGEYRKWCGISCSCKDPDTVAKSKSTRKDRYGDTNFNGVSKAKQTRLEKYGSYHGKDFGAKLRATKKANHGDENYVNVEKAKQTRLEKYGDENYVNVEKAKQTKEERYGDASWNNRDKFKATLAGFSDEKRSEIAEKRQATNISRYGVEFPMQSEQVKTATKQTVMKKYGVGSALQIDLVREAGAAAIKEKSWYFILTEKDYKPEFTKDEYIANRDPFKKWKWRCLKCGDVFESEYDDGHHHRCYKCQPNTVYGTSLMEQELADFVKSVTTERVFSREPENRRLLKNMEVDILIPSLKLGIEFDGLFYHSEKNGNKNMNYHIGKTDACRNAGYRLIHVFEDEWTHKREIVKSRLTGILTKRKRRIFARKCEVKPIDNDVKDRFLEKYHIQGRDVSSVRLGLFYHGRLVAVMTFVKSRFDKSYQWELSRYATVAKFTVVGGAGKLLSHFEKTCMPASLVTYADRRWSVGGLYDKLGFTLTHASKPGYFYVKNGQRYSRVVFQKHKLEKLLPTYDPNLTEWQNMQNAGYDRIWDCGNLVYAKTYP